LRLSWRGIVLEIARWPVVVWALVNVILGIRRPYMITPKGVSRTGGPRLLRLYGPYLVLTLAPLAALWAHALKNSGTPIRGYYGLAFLNGVFGAVLLVVTLLIELRGLNTLATSKGVLVRSNAVILGAVSLIVLAVVLSAGVSWQPTLQALR
jgi:cellulose synthase (UDP-forming)